jgi:hypothetical protein
MFIIRVKQRWAGHNAGMRKTRNFSKKSKKQGIN